STVVFLPVASRTSTPFHGEYTKTSTTGYSSTNGWHDRTDGHQSRGSRTSTYHWTERFGSGCKTTKHQSGKRAKSSYATRLRASSAGNALKNCSRQEFKDRMNEPSASSDPQAQAEKLEILMRGVKKSIFGGLVRNPPVTVQALITEVTNIERALQARATQPPAIAAYTTNGVDSSWSAHWTSSCTASA
ncbi:unnamed protein product, partial [Ixodes persulcatus]